MLDRNLMAGDVFAGRYEIVREVGRGAFGVVYEARDAMLGGRTALKILRQNRIDTSSSRWREAAAMRRLEIPGVARLFDEGTVDETSYMAVEFIDGEHFPEPRQPRTWKELRPLAVRLLEILALVHGQGVVHGDIKPSNVMVVGEEIKLLDFGLATSSTANSYESGEGSRGTPVYMAPELFRDAPPSPQTDLFAVGTMLFEALSGRPFFESTSLFNWIRLVTTEGPPSLAEAMDDAPDEAVRLVDNLLRRDPADRPDSATEALGLLESSGGSRGLPWFGPRDRIDAIVARLDRGESVDVVGPRGLGGERSIREAFTMRPSLATHELGPGDRPFESLLRSPGIELTLPATSNIEEMEAAARARLVELLEQGDVLAAFVDVDTWTSELLDSVREHGIVVRRLVKPRADDARIVELEPWSEAELVEFFAGPEPGFHLSTGPARILWERSLGWASDVFAELDAWRQFGLAHLTGDKIRVSARGLNMLRRGLRPRAPLPLRSVDEELAEVLRWIALGEPLPTGELVDLADFRPSRARELLGELERRRLVREGDDGWRRVRDVDVLSAASDEWMRGARERLLGRQGDPESALRLAISLGDSAMIRKSGLASARRFIERGDDARAHAVFRQLVTTLRSLENRSHEHVLREWAIFSLNGLSAEILEEVLWAWGDHDPELRSLVEGFRLASVAPGEKAAEFLEGLEPFDDLELEVNRILSVGLAHGWFSDGYHRATDQLEEMAERLEDPEWILAKVRMRRGYEAYRKGDFGRSARLHLQAAAVAPNVVERLKSTINAGWSLIDAYEFDAARDLARAHLPSAIAIEHCHFELQLLLMERQARWRGGELPEPYPELLSAVREVGYGPLVSLAVTLEAVIHWRNGERERAATVLESRARRWTRDGGNWPNLVVAHFHAFLEGTDLRMGQMLEAIDECPFPRLKAQMLGFASYSADVDDPEAMRARARELVPEEEHGVRLECFAIAEIDELDQIGRASQP